ncbi:MAG: hypothetical protein ABSG45_00665 [Nitrososphaerales archaeon]|jgi:hypothetical protein
MRTLDVVVAAGYAVICISLVSLISPYGSEVVGATALADARASSAAAAYVQAVGLPFIATASPSQFCSSLQTLSNATIVLGGEIDGLNCHPAPSLYLGSSGIGFMVSGRQVKVEAWVAEL